MTLEILEFLQYPLAPTQLQKYIFWPLALSSCLGGLEVQVPVQAVFGCRLYLGPVPSSKLNFEMLKRCVTVDFIVLAK